MTRKLIAAGAVYVIYEVVSTAVLLGIVAWGYF
jgi:hypothetical protein